MPRMLSTPKNKRLVGLDIQAGSVAATEVWSNGHTAVTRFGTMPLPPGVVREGEVADAEQLTAVLKELFAHNKLAKYVRLGLASQRVAVRLLRLPAIDDHKELETAVRFQAQDLVPMPLDQAVLDWQVVGHTSGDDGERRLDVVVVAARREAVRGMVSALRGAGLRPTGVDLSAFGMIRALANGDRAPVGPGTHVDAPVATSGANDQGVAEHMGGDGSAAVVAPSTSTRRRRWPRSRSSAAPRRWPKRLAAACWSPSVAISPSPASRPPAVGASPLLPNCVAPLALLTIVAFAALASSANSSPPPLLLVIVAVPALELPKNSARPPLLLVMVEFPAVAVSMNTTAPWVWLVMLALAAELASKKNVAPKFLLRMAMALAVVPLKKLVWPPSFVRVVMRLVSELTTLRRPSLVTGPRILPGVASVPSCKVPQMQIVVPPV